MGSNTELNSLAVQIFSVIVMSFCFLALTIKAFGGQHWYFLLVGNVERPRHSGHTRIGISPVPFFFVFIEEGLMVIQGLIEVAGFFFKKRFF